MRLSVSSRGFVCVVAWSSVFVLVSVAVVAAATEPWTLTGIQFTAGTFENTAFTQDGKVQLSSWAVPSNRSMVLDVGSAGSADSLYARSPFVLRDTDGSYKMWYSGQDGNRNRMMYATSPDGFSWTKIGVIVDVLTPPYYFDSVGGASVIKIGSTYHMWFHGGFWSGGPFGFWGQIYHATSSNGVNWSITGVALPPNQSWDIGMVNSPWVLQDAHGVFWMYFAGWDGSNTRLGVATSVNGTWFVPHSSNPILALGASGAFDSMDMLSGSVVDGPGWTLWYCGSDRLQNRIGLAHSADGFNWTKDASNPTFLPEPSPSWDDAGVAYPDLLPGTAGPRLYFAGSDGTYLRIGVTSFQSLPPAVFIGTYTTPVFDSQALRTTWESLSVQDAVLAHTDLLFGVRVGNRSMPDLTWSAWELVSDGSPTSDLHDLVSRYIQVQAVFVSNDVNVSPSLISMSVQYRLWSPAGVSSGGFALVSLAALGGGGVGGLVALAAGILRKKG